MDEVWISACGELAPDEDDGIPALGHDGDPWPGFPEDANCTSPDQLTQAAHEIRGHGNDYFKAANYSQALEKYDKALRYARDEPEMEVQVLCYLNRSATHLRLGDAYQALLDAQMVLGVQAGHPKGLFRQAQAYVKLGQLGEAQDSLHEALRQQPDDKSIQQELRRVQAAIQKAKREEKRRCEAMFGGKLKSDREKRSEAEENAHKQRAVAREEASFEAAWQTALEEGSASVTE